MKTKLFRFAVAVTILQGCSEGGDTKTLSQLLDSHTYTQLQEAGNTIEKASTKSRTIQRKLRSVESISYDELPEQTTFSQPEFSLFQDTTKESDIQQLNHQSSDV